MITILILFTYILQVYHRVYRIQEKCLQDECLCIFLIKKVVTIPLIFKYMEDSKNQDICQKDLTEFVVNINYKEKGIF